MERANMLLPSSGKGARGVEAYCVRTRELLISTSQSAEVPNQVPTSIWYRWFPSFDCRFSSHSPSSSSQSALLLLFPAPKGKAKNEIYLPTSLTDLGFIFCACLLQFIDERLWVYYVASFEVSHCGFCGKTYLRSLLWYFLHTRNCWIKPKTSHCRT